MAGLSWLLALAMLLPCPLLAAQIQVSLDRNPVPVSESFTITFTADEEPDDDPDFTPLQADFEILNQGHSSQFSIINGQAKRRVTWQVQVMAKQAGTLEIPPIAFGRDRSKAFAVTVTHGAVRGKQGGEASLYLEAEAEPRNPYVQAQVILTLRVLSRVGFSGDLSQPEIPDAVVEKLEEDREYVTLRDGVQFKVDERRFAVFPQKSGRLTIGPVNLTAQIAGSGGGFGPFFRPATRQQRLHSEPIDLEVRPIPAQFIGVHWLPAARLELSEQWLPASRQITGGEPLTRTLTLKAEGATAGMLPELAGSGLPAEVRQYPDQPVTKEAKATAGINSQRQQKIALLATRAGSYAVPALEIPWWNTVTDRLEVAKLPAQTMTVMAAAQSPPPEPIPNQAEAAPPAAASAEGAAGAPILTASPAAGAAGYWVWLAGFLGLGWLGTAIAWWYQGRKAGPARKVNHPAESQKENALLKKLEHACRRHDPVAARRALEDWAAARWPEKTWVGLGAALGENFQRELTLLDQSLYGKNPQTWRGQGLWAAVRVHLKPASASPGESRAGGLQPLYPEHSS